MIVTLVFNNADAKPKSSILRVEEEAVPLIMEWYGSFFSGDRYIVTVDGRNVRMDHNGNAEAP